MAGQKEVGRLARGQMDEAPDRLVDLMQRLGAAAQEGVSVERLTQTGDGAELTIRADDGPSAVRWFRHLVAWPIAARVELLGVRAAGSRNGTDAVETTVSIHWRRSTAGIVQAAGRSTAARRLRDALNDLGTETSDQMRSTIETRLDGVLQRLHTLLDANTDPRQELKILNAILACERDRARLLGLALPAALVLRLEGLDDAA